VFVPINKNEKNNSINISLYLKPGNSFFIEIKKNIESICLSARINELYKEPNATSPTLLLLIIKVN